MLDIKCTKCRFIYISKDLASNTFRYSKIHFPNWPAPYSFYFENPAYLHHAALRHLVLLSDSWLLVNLSALYQKSPLPAQEKEIPASCHSEECSKLWNKESFVCRIWQQMTLLYSSYQLSCCIIYGFKSHLFFSEGLSFRDVSRNKL